MAYILKNTSGLISTRVTDTGRQKISQGNFNIAYFQIGDSEVCYDCLSSYNQVNNNILEPCFNSQNSTAYPAINKQYLKYPYYVDQVSGNTYAIPFMDSTYDSVYNQASPRGFFSGTPGTFVNIPTSSHTINSNFTVDFLLITGGNYLIVSSANTCDITLTGEPQSSQFVTIFYDNAGICTTFDCTYPILTYRITAATPSSDFDIFTDRNTPNFSSFSPGTARLFIYPSGMTPFYDSYTPSPHWYDDVIDFESVCTTDAFDVLVWNMNIPWTETPAGINPSVYVDFNGFGSKTYIGTKEYLGYNSSSGHTIIDTGSTIQPNSYYNNSFGEQVSVTPEEQKSIAIVHYTNNTIDYYYGEKFAFEPYDTSNPSNTIGQARNFRVSLPWVMWHKSPFPASTGQTFYVDPPGFEPLNLVQPYYIQSKINVDMNDRGIRYYNLWDINANYDGYPNRVGKVFPDQKIVIFDDEELIAAMSYKSNRNWTLPAPKVSLITPNVCSGGTSVSFGILSGSNEYMYVTYRMDNSIYSYNSLHCNYYQKIQGPIVDCNVDPQNVAVRFGNEFSYMSDGTSITGYSATDFKILCQYVSGDTRPDPTQWREIDFTTQLSLLGSFIDPTSISANTFVISDINYNSAPLYDLSNYIDGLTQLNDTGTTLNFGDEYFFYGTIETDITATIYEMRYLCNLNGSEFQNSSNPTWTSGTTSVITEIGLFDNDKDLVVISKLQSPVQRIGLQQFLVKFDF